MIILRIKAECLHRYRRLRLTDLPERGIIALSGDNESGKSAIGGIICFALFGRTFPSPRTVSASWYTGARARGRSPCGFASRAATMRSVAISPGMASSQRA